MKQQTPQRLPIRFSLAFALALAAWLPVAATAADTSMKPMEGSEHQMMPEPGNDKQPMEGKMKESCQAMMEMKKQMMAEMKTQDAELTAEIARMNSAPEDQKLDLTTAIVTRMAEQRTAMHEETAKMEEKMMKHMMEHMQMGNESMSGCPMMKGMNDHSEHAKNDGVVQQSVCKSGSA